MTNKLLIVCKTTSLGLLSTFLDIITGTAFSSKSCENMIEIIYTSQLSHIELYLHLYIKVIMLSSIHKPQVVDHIFSQENISFCQARKCLDCTFYFPLLIMSGL